MRDVVRGLVDPIGLALDARNNRIFWSDAKAGKVQCANLDGSRVCDVATGTPNPKPQPQPQPPLELLAQIAPVGTQGL